MEETIERPQEKTTSIHDAVAAIQSKIDLLQAGGEEDRIIELIRQQATAIALPIERLRQKMYEEKYIQDPNKQRGSSIGQYAVSSNSSRPALETIYRFDKKYQRRTLSEIIDNLPKEGTEEGKNQREKYRLLKMYKDCQNLLTEGEITDEVSAQALLDYYGNILYEALATYSDGNDTNVQQEEHYSIFAVVDLIEEYIDRSGLEIPISADIRTDDTTGDDDPYNRYPTTTRKGVRAAYSLVI